MMGEQRHTFDASQLLLHEIIEEVPIRVFWKDCEGRYLGCNSLFARDAGFDNPEQLIGKTDYEMGWRDQAELYRADDQAVINSAIPKLSYEEPQTTPDGRTIWLRTSKVPLRGDGDDVIGMLGIYEDITAHKQRELEYGTIVHTTHDGFCVARASDGLLLEVNDTYCTMLGYSRETLMTMKISELDANEGSAETEAYMQRLIKRKQDFFETRHRRSDGSLIDLEVSVTYIDINQGLLCIFCRDISDRIHKEQQLRELISRQQATLEATADGILVVDRKGAWRSYNRRFAEMWRIPAAILTSGDDRQALSFVLDQLLEPQAFIDKVLELYNDPEATSFDVIHFKDGRVFERYSREQRIADEIVGRVWSFRDVTDRHRTEEQLRIAQFALDKAPDAVIWMQSDGYFVYVNDEACRRLGYSRNELLTMSVADIDPTISDDVLSSMVEATRASGFGHIESVHRAKDGTELPVDIMVSCFNYGEREYHCGFVRDISERKQFEEQLLQSQKMEAIGTLVGGIAHDFNNMLAAMQGNLYLARQFAGLPPELKEKLGNIDQLSRRGAEMVQQLLTFARKDRVHIRILPLTSMFKEAIKLAKPAIAENIQFDVTVCEESLKILGDSTQLQQVLMNLLNNAVDALKSQSDPRIACSLQRWDVDAEFRSMHGIAADCTAMAHIQIADNGVGIGDEDQDKIFEPFFSTKEVGKGTGLGLAMVYGSVQTHGGVIEVESRRGRGSCFHLYFPLVEQEGEAVQLEKSPVSAGGCGETILLVDDEQELRHTIAEVLQSLGYRVYQAGDGREALEQLHEHADQIALVITDIIMPKMGGIALARAIRNDDPDLPIILATGYDKQHILSKEQLPNCMEISKPFDFDLLSKQIRAFLIR